MEDKKYWLEFDNLTITSATKSYVIIRGKCTDGYYDNPTICMYRIKRPMFNKMLKEFLDEKQKYFERTKYWAGSTLGFEMQVKQYGTAKIHNEEVDFEEIVDKDELYMEVNYYTVIGYEELEMEHG